MKSIAIACFSLVLMAGCASAKKQSEAKLDVVTFDMLSAETQAAMRAKYGPQIDQQWQEIVRKTCEKEPWVRCFCCTEPGKSACNPNNWDCCNSVVFPPQDASSCVMPSPCNCPPPPS
jgi:hypothetical protein